MMGFIGSKLLGYGIAALTVLGAILGFRAKFRKEGRELEKQAQEVEEKRRVDSRKETDRKVAGMEDSGVDDMLDRNGWLRDKE